MKRKDIGLLISLDALLEESNVTRAARVLHLTQPALSAQLVRMRRLFGDPLLIPSPSGRGMTPTARGLTLKRPLRDLLHTLQGLIDRPDVFDPRTAVRNYVVAANDNAATMLGVGLAARLQASAGADVRLSLINPSPKELEQLLEKRGVDIVLSSKAGMPKDLTVRELLKDRFRVAQRKNHPRGKRAPSLRNYAAQTHVLVSAARGGFSSTIDDVLSEHGLSRKVALSVQHYSLVPQVLLQTDCVATLPARFLAAFDDRLDTFKMPFEIPPFVLAAGWHPRDETDEGHQWLREQLFDVSSA